MKVQHVLFVSSTKVTNLWADDNEVKLYIRLSQGSRIRSSLSLMWLRGRSICSESLHSTSVAQENRRILTSLSMSPLQPVSQKNFHTVNN